MRKDKVRCNIRMNEENGYQVRDVRGYLVDLPFGYTGVIHRPLGYTKEGKQYWCISEYTTGCLITAGWNEATRPEVAREARYMICKMGLARFEMGLRVLFRDFELDTVN